MKKFLKFVGSVAVIGAAVAGGIALYNKYKETVNGADDDFDDFDDFDNFDVDFSDSEAQRGYTSLNTDTANADAEAETTEE